MAQDAEPEAAPERQQAAREVEREAVDEVAQQQDRADVSVGRQGERGQEVLAELAVGDPRRAGLEGLERERVDEHRPAAQELDVVGGGVAQREAGPEGRRLGVEGQERRVAELPERPLVGVADERDLLGPDDGVRPVVGRERQVCGLIGDEDARARRACRGARS